MEGARQRSEEAKRTVGEARYKEISATKTEFKKKWNREKRKAKKRKMRSFFSFLSSVGGE
jgi:predicted ribosome quality control (RQC) complex YloA/Tae2 family protein